jgi:hypothetical protein
MKNWTRKLPKDNRDAEKFFLEWKFQPDDNGFEKSPVTSALFNARPVSGICEWGNPWTKNEDPLCVHKFEITNP